MKAFAACLMLVQGNGHQQVAIELGMDRHQANRHGLVTIELDLDMYE